MASVIRGYHYKENIQVLSSYLAKQLAKQLVSWQDNKKLGDVLTDIVQCGCKMKVGGSSLHSNETDTAGNLKGLNSRQNDAHTMCEQLQKSSRKLHFCPYVQTCKGNHSEGHSSALNLQKISKCVKSVNRFT